MRPYWTIDHAEDPRADDISASKPFITIPTPGDCKGHDPYCQPLSVSVLINSSHQRHFIDRQKMRYNQSFFNFLGIKDAAVIYVNLIILNNNQNELPATPIKTGAEWIRLKWLT